MKIEQIKERIKEQKPNITEKEILSLLKDIEKYFWPKSDNSESYFGKGGYEYAKELYVWIFWDKQYKYCFEFDNHYSAKEDWVSIAPYFWKWEEYQYYKDKMIKTIATDWSKVKFLSDGGITSQWFYSKEKLVLGWDWKFLDKNDSLDNYEISDITKFKEYSEVFWKSIDIPKNNKEMAENGSKLPVLRFECKKEFYCNDLYIDNDRFWYHIFKKWDIFYVNSCQIFTFMQFNDSYYCREWDKSLAIYLIGFPEKCIDLNKLKEKGEWSWEFDFTGIKMLWFWIKYFNVYKIGKEWKETKVSNKGLVKISHQNQSHLTQFEDDEDDEF